MKSKDIIISSVGIIISGGLLYFTFRNVDFGIAFNILKKSRYEFIFIFFVSMFFELFFRSLKWFYILLANSKKIKFWDIFKFEVISLGINNILPFRMGEITKMLLVNYFYKLSKTTTLSTVFVERLLDSLIIFSIFILYSRLGNINILLNQNTFILLNILIVVIIVLFIFSDRILKHKFFVNVEKKYPAVYNFAFKLKEGGKCFKNPKLTLYIFLSGIAQWNFDVLNNYFIAKALSINVIDYFKAAITVFAGSIAASIPSMPGYFGNYEFAISRVCMLWGIEKNLSTIYPTLIHVLTYLSVTVLAIIFIYSIGFSFKKIINLTKRSQ